MCDKYGMSIKRANEIAAQLKIEISKLIQPSNCDKAICVLAERIAELESQNNNLMILSNDYHIENCELRERLSQYEPTTQKVASSEMEQTTEIMYALRVKGEKELICRADTVKALERMIDRFYYSQTGVLEKGKKVTFEEFMSNKEKLALEIHIKLL